MKKITVDICRFGFLMAFVMVLTPQAIWAGFTQDDLGSFETKDIFNNPNKLKMGQLAWGERQLERLLKDRPAMTSYIRRGDDLWKWMVHQFAGEYVEGGIWWDARDPKPLWDSMYYGAGNGKKASIRVTKNIFMYKEYFWGKPKTGPVLWYETIFEIFNLITLKPIYELDELARKGGIGRENYILRRMLAERQTGQAAHDFFNKVWIPHCKRLNLPYEDKYLVKVYGDGIKVLSPEEVIKQKFNPNNFNYKYFSDQYDRITAGK
jgi:hypothetical protein